MKDFECLWSSAFSEKWCTNKTEEELTKFIQRKYKGLYSKINLVYMSPCEDNPDRHHYLLEK